MKRRNALLKMLLIGSVCSVMTMIIGLVALLLWRSEPETVSDDGTQPVSEVAIIERETPPKDDLFDGTASESEALSQSGTVPESEISSESEIVSESTEESGGGEVKKSLTPLYCTIWPLVSLEIVDNPQDKTRIGEAPAGSMLCVLSEEDGYFQIRYGECDGYIDSRFCMINLPEYIGDLCEYDIRNAYKSIFRVHGFDIPEITGNVVKGYENVSLGNSGEFLVPYLYPCVKKLRRAADNAAEDGYKLRIYDAFRPNEATRYLYDTVELLLDVPVSSESETTFSGMMTDGRWKLASFLAASVSAHNMGIALDLTLVSMQTGDDLVMQTDMHDLSWHSSLQYNNDEAKLLAKYMKDAGFKELVSEWWHFQDNETRDKIELSSYLKGGVSAEGWKKDGGGWKYRLRDGSFYKNETVSIDGEEYTFDTDGYVTGQEW